MILLKGIKYLIIGIKEIINFTISFIYHILYGLIIVLTLIPKYLIIGIRCLFSEKKQKELEMEDKINPIIITTLSILTYLICIFLLTRWYVQNERSKNFSKDINQSTKIIKEEEKNKKQYEDNNNSSKLEQKYPDDLTILNVNLTPYIKQNPETVAWLQVNGTNISYPVVQHSDNDYYLNHDFRKRKVITGWVFADYRDKFDPFNNNTIIYAHNTYANSMFSQLTRTQTTNWLENPNYHYIKLSTRKSNSIWQVFSTYTISPTTDYLQSIFNSIDNYENFLNTLKNRSIYDFKTDISPEDKIITLSTCNSTGKKRIAVHAKLIKQENK